MLVTRTRRDALNAGLVALFFAVLAGAFALSAAGTGAQTPDDQLADASRIYVEQQGEAYAGPCDETNHDDHVGMWCSEVQSQTDETAVVNFGPTFSHFVVGVTFDRTAAGWEVVAEEPIVLNGAVCLTYQEEFASEGHINTVDMLPGDALQVLDFRLGSHDGCERLAIDLGGIDGLPAQYTGPISAEFLEGEGVIRIHLQEDFGIEPPAEVITEAFLGGRLIDSAFLVRGLEGNAYIDVVLGEAAVAYVFVMEDPARIVVDAAAGLGTIPGVSTATNIVTVDPAPYSTQSNAIDITGYARTFESTVIATLRMNGEVVAEDFTMAATWIETWGEYELTLSLDGVPAGEAELFVGEHSAVDGSEQGVYIPLTIE